MLKGADLRRGEEEERDQTRAFGSKSRRVSSNSPLLVDSLISNDDSLISCPLGELMKRSSLAGSEMNESLVVFLSEVDRRAEVVLEHEPRGEGDDLRELVLYEQTESEVGKSVVRRNIERGRKQTRLPDSLDVRKSGVDVCPSVRRVDEDLEIGGDGLERERLKRGAMSVDGVEKKTRYTSTHLRPSRVSEAKEALVSTIRAGEGEHERRWLVSQVIV